MFCPKTSWNTYGQISGVYTAGELALVSSPLFRDHRLRLYRQRISPVFNWFMPLISVSYLIVKGSVPVMELRIDFNPCRSPLEPTRAGQLPVYPIYWCDMEAGQVDEVFPFLERRLQELDDPMLPLDNVPVPPELHADMARLHMIRKQTDHIWLPTDYGSSLGLVDGYMASGRGGPCHTFFIPSARMEELRRAMDWDKTCREEPRAVMPLEQRLERARQGLPGSNASAARMVRMVRAFGAIPMADYMATHPDAAEKLRQQFGELSTFQEAADRIYQTCVETPCSEPALKSCMDLITQLVLPGCPINDCFGQSQNTEPPVRVPEAVDLLRRPFPGVLLGAAMAAGQPCLLRNTPLILNEFDDLLTLVPNGPQTSCSELLVQALMPRVLANEESRQKAVFAIFRLFIEPFALLNQSAARLKQA